MTNCISTYLFSKIINQGILNHVSILSSPSLSVFSGSLSSDSWTTSTFLWTLRSTTLSSKQLLSFNLMGELEPETPLFSKPEKEKILALGSILFWGNTAWTFDIFFGVRGEFGIWVDTRDDEKSSWLKRKYLD